MDVEDLGDGWMEATGNRGSSALRWNKSGLSIGALLLGKAGLVVGDRVRVLVHQDDGRIALLRADDDETTGNKLSGDSGSSATIAASTARKIASVEPPVELDVIEVEDGAIIASYE